MSKSVLVVGASGMAGHVIATYLREQGHSVTTTTNSRKFDDQSITLDLTDKQSLLDFLASNEFDVVVNCAGILVKASEEHKDLSTYVNAHFPHLLEAYYADSPTKIIHLSTDCVFSGKHAPYYENSFMDGEMFYDKSKALGEIINEKDLTFRMSIIGPDMQADGTGLFNWFYQQSGDINGYTGSIWNGITTIELAKAIHEAIAVDLTGLYHLVSKQGISKFDLLGLFKKVFNREDISIHPTEGVTHDKTLVNTREDFAFTVPSYEDMIIEMKQWIDNHPAYYRHYEK